MGFFEVFAGALAALYAVVKSYGLAIILLTLLVRILVMPLSIKSTRSMREMQRIGPEVKKLQQKYKGDRQKLAEEQMKLYKEHGVNPMGGCAPLVLQFPVLIALYWVIRFPLKYMGFEQGRGSEWVSNGMNGIMEQLRNSALATDLMEHALSVHRFLGLRLDCAASNVWSGSSSLAVPEPCAPGSPWLAILPYALLVAGMGYTTYYQQKQMQVAQGSTPQAQQMQMLTRIMPVMLMWFAITFPSGVVVYWLTTNLWTIIQQRIMLKAAPPLVPTAAEGDGKPTPAPRPSSPSKKSPAGKPKSADRQPAAGNAKPSPDGRRRSASAAKRKKKR